VYFPSFIKVDNAVAYTFLIYHKDILPLFLKKTLVSYVFYKGNTCLFGNTCIRRDLRASEDCKFLDCGNRGTMPQQFL